MDINIIALTSAISNNEHYQCAAQEEKLVFDIFVKTEMDI